MPRGRLGRGLLLGSVSAFALPLAAAYLPANAAGLPPGMALLLEGGGVCPEDNNGTFSASYSYAGVTANSLARFGPAGCGWTGRIGLFQDRPDIVFGWADFWGVFVRHQDFKSSDFSASGNASLGGSPKYYFAGINSAGNFDEDRTIVDFEVGKDIGIGSDGAKLRVFGGIRYAHYSSNLRGSGDTQGVYCLISPGGCNYYSDLFTIHAGHSFNGVGPRLGATGQVPLFGSLFLTGSVSGSLLWGDHQVRLALFGFGGGHSKFSDDDLVTNAEGEVGVGMPFFANGGTLIIGARWEGWFDQSQFKNYDLNLSFGERGSVTGNGSLDRNNWGPFMRLNIPLGPAAPP